MEKAWKAEKTTELLKIDIVITTIFTGRRKTTGWWLCVAKCNADSQRSAVGPEEELAGFCGIGIGRNLIIS